MTSSPTGRTGLPLARTLLRLVTLCTALLSLAPPAQAASPGFVDRPELRSFIDEMVAKHNFDSASLVSLFSHVHLRPDIIEAISHPAEGKPWYQYRPIFLTRARINAGVKFWNQHAAALEKAQRTYGVPPRIVVAIIGVETRFGTYKGKYPVIDSLSTLAFDYPKRGAFFRSELEQFLLLAREEKLDPLAVKGSYAGAMGGPQFISSSYRHYAVDFDGDGKRDLIDDVDDMIGSVANYFSEHGWQAGQPIAARAQVKDSDDPGLDTSELKPQYDLATLRAHGVSTRTKLPKDTVASLIRLEGKQGPEYWLGLQNFYVITRYNHSPLYAMAVYQLGDAIAQARDRQTAHDKPATPEHPGE